MDYQQNQERQNNMLIDDIKRHGAMLGLEAELHVRLTTAGNAREKKNWTLVFSSCTMACQLAEELRKLSEDDKAPQHVKD